MNEKRPFGSFVEDAKEQETEMPPMQRCEAISLSLASQNFTSVAHKAHDDGGTIVIVENGKAIATVTRYQGEELPSQVSYSTEAMNAVGHYEDILRHTVHEKRFYRKSVPVILDSFAKVLDRHTLLEIHEAIAFEHNLPYDIRDENALDYVLKKPFLKIDGVSLYPSIEEMAAVLASEIVARKPFKEGNVDTAAIAYTTFLRANGNDYEPSPDLFKALLAGGEGTDIYACLVREACWRIER